MALLGQQRKRSPPSRSWLRFGTVVARDRNLPDETDGGLQSPWRIGLAADCPKRRTGRGGIDSAECYVIRNVECLKADLHIPSFGELEVLIQGRVDLIGIVAPQVVEL